MSSKFLYGLTTNIYKITQVTRASLLMSNRGMRHALVTIVGMPFKEILLLRLRHFLEPLWAPSQRIGRLPPLQKRVSKIRFALPQIPHIPRRQTAKAILAGRRVPSSAKWHSKRKTSSDARSP